MVQKKINATKSMSFWSSVWKSWCEGKSIIKVLEIKEHKPVELSRLLKKFYAEVKNKCDLSALPRHKFFHVYILSMSNHMVFFSFNLELICTHQSTLCNFSFSKTHSRI